MSRDNRPGSTDADGRNSNQPSQRQLRVGELVRHELSEILARGGFHDPELQGRIITVPEVRMTPDLKTALVFIMPLGGAGEKEIVAALNRNKKRIRGLISQKMTLKYMPGLKFEIDRSFQASSRIDELLRSPEVARDLSVEKEVARDLKSDRD
jgi:ribosome-binding factor A